MATDPDPAPAEAERDRLRAELAALRPAYDRLREALLPFAAQGSFRPPTLDATPDWHSLRLGEVLLNVTVGDLRRAARAYYGPAGPAEPAAPAPPPGSAPTS